jgi:PiT family inorganic phosphate transporter
VVASGTDAVLGDGIVSKVIVPALVSPILAGAIAELGVLVVYAMIKRFQEERAERGFRWAQVASSLMVALAHGTNDALEDDGRDLAGADRQRQHQRQPSVLMIRQPPQ